MVKVRAESRRELANAGVCSARAAAGGAQLSLFKPRAKRRGKHRGGRPPKGARSSERHETREAFKPTEPVHVVLRVARSVGRLRRRVMYQAIRWATIAIADRHEDCRIIHASIQGNHLHLIVEAMDRIELARGMQAFQISAAKRLNRARTHLAGERIRGAVFPDRYHVTILRSPRQVRHALAYVLNNWRWHGEDQHGQARGWTMDPFSSAVFFDGWKERARRPFVPPLPEGYEPLLVWFARSWLLTTGWRRHGLVGVREVPKGKARAQPGQSPNPELIATTRPRAS